MEFSRKGYGSGLPFPFPGDLPDPGVEPRSPGLQADTLLPEPPGQSLGKSSLSEMISIFWEAYKILEFSYGICLKSGMYLGFHP